MTGNWPLLEEFELFVLLLLCRTGTTSSSESLNVRSTWKRTITVRNYVCRKQWNARTKYCFTESPVVVDVGSFDLLVCVDPLLPPFIDSFLILVFGESSAIITSAQIRTCEYHKIWVIINQIYTRAHDMKCCWKFNGSM